MRRSLLLALSGVCLLPGRMNPQASVQQTNCPRILDPGTIVVAQSIGGNNANYPIIILACYLLDPSQFTITPGSGGAMGTISVTGSVASGAAGTTGNIQINNGSGFFAAIASINEGYLSLSNVTTNNATTSAHGFLPKIPGTAGLCLDSSTGTWLSQVCGTASGSGAPIEVRNEIPSGTINGVNTTFTLENTPIGGSVNVYLNGLKLTPSVDLYTFSGNTITFSTYVPETGDVLNVDYLHN